MTFRKYTSQKLTATYLRKLEVWDRKIQGCAGPKENVRINGLSDDELGEILTAKSERNRIKQDYFPRNRINDYLLILDFRQLFDYNSMFMFPYVECEDRNLNGKVARVVGKIDRSDRDTAEYHPPDNGASDLALRIKDDGSIFPWYVGSDRLARGENPPYIFLPHPTRLKKFTRFLGHFTKTPKDLEMRLNEYYARLK